MRTVVLYYFKQSYDEVDYEITSVNQFPDDATDVDINFALNISTGSNYSWQQVNQWFYEPNNRVVYTPVKDRDN